MTEQEARSKWCPMGRVLGGVNKGTYNRMEEDGEGSGLSLCLASDCAMWVWDKYKYEIQGHCGLIRRNK